MINIMSCFFVVFLCAFFTCKVLYTFVVCFISYKKNVCVIYYVEIYGIFIAPSLNT